MLTDFQILQHGPGQEDAPWPYEAQLYFGRQVEAAVRAQDTALIRRLVEALGEMVALYNTDDGCTGLTQYKESIKAITAGLARLKEESTC